MFTGSTTVPLPTHSPWSGGVSLVWFPLSTVRWSWNVRPVNPVEPGFEAAIAEACPGTTRGAFDLLCELGLRKRGIAEMDMPARYAGERLGELGYRKARDLYAYLCDTTAALPPDS